MLTTLYNNKCETVTRIGKGGVTESVQKPVVVCRYNNFMGGVDLADHYIASYARKTIKWWRKMFFLMLEIGVVNAYILQNTNRPPEKGNTTKGF